MKTLLKDKAILLRKKGRSYNEILEKIDVSKSTLSLWLRSVGLSKKQKQRLTQKKLESIRRGWEACRQKRIKKTNRIMQNARLEIDNIDLNKSNLWLMGIMLYWAEGTKIKNHNISQGVVFSNQDPLMIRLFLIWLTECIKIESERIKFDIYIHKTKGGSIIKVKKYWSKVTGFSITRFDKIYFKKNKINTLRRNITRSYNGLLRVQVKKSTDLNRKIKGWIEGICQKWGIV